MRLPHLAFCILAITASSSTWAQDPVVQLSDPFPNLSFSDPVGFQHAGDGTNIFYVVEQAGVIRSFENDATTKSTTTFLDIADRVVTGFEQGLLGLTFHPDHENNGYFYVDYSPTGAQRTRISRFNRDPVNPDVADPNSEVILLEVSQPFDGHNAGQIAFGPDGYLYVTLGDGGSLGDPQNHGQNPTTLLGSILRLDVDGGGDPLDCGSGTGSATIPADNPLVDGAGGDCDEIFAYGFRNPWRMSFDSATGDIWAGDVGQFEWEEVDLVTAGANYGWNVLEGTHCYPTPPCDDTGKTPPVWEYGHTGGHCAITGGYVYWGAAIPELQGRYVYADWCSGFIWAFDPDDPGGTNTLIETFAAFSLNTFGTDEAGELYALAENGRIRKFVRVPPTTGEEAPITLAPSLVIHGPNPVSSRTSLRFLAPSAGHVLLSVYDILGREVVRLFDREVRPLTHHDVTFDATRLPAGAYVARLITGGTIVTQKLTVVR